MYIYTQILYYIQLSYNLASNWLYKPCNKKAHTESMSL